MKAAGAAGVRVATHGRVPAGSADLAAAKVGSLLRVAAEPVPPRSGPALRDFLRRWVDPAIVCDATAQSRRPGRMRPGGRP
jgi:hypothetical protein